MGKEIIDYDIVQGCPGRGYLDYCYQNDEVCPCYRLLSERVKEKISQGWYPIGWVSMINDRYDTLNMHKDVRTIEHSACQAIVKYKQQNTK